MQFKRSSFNSPLSYFRLIPDIFEPVQQAALPRLPFAAHTGECCVLIMMSPLDEQHQQDDQHSNQEHNDAQLPSQAGLFEHVVNLLLRSLQPCRRAFNICVELFKHTALLLQLFMYLQTHLPYSRDMRPQCVQVIILLPAAMPR